MLGEVGKVQEKSRVGAAPMWGLCSVLGALARPPVLQSMLGLALGTGVVPVIGTGDGKR